MARQLLFYSGNLYRCPELTVSAMPHTALTDPAILRALEALFHFTQGKELAGQELAWGCLQFATDALNSSAAEHAQLLAQEQELHFETFSHFSDPAALGLWYASVVPCCCNELRQMRIILATPGCHAQHDSALGERWFALCSRRLDAMKAVEDALRGALFDRLQNQAQHLHTLQQKLEHAHTALEDRKLVERAKGLLMQHRRLPEDAAYSLLRKMAMNQGRKLPEVARSVLAMASTQR